MDPRQLAAAKALRIALHTATAAGALDVLQPYCSHPDSINDVMDSLDNLIDGPQSVDKGTRCGA